jgi:protein TonB
MPGRRRALGGSFAASVGVHLGLLAMIAVLWAPPVQRTLGDLIPVQLLPVAGDSPAGAPAGERAAGPKPLPAAPAPARAEVQRARPGREAAAAPDAADRLAELGTKGPETLLAAGESDATGPRAVGTAPAFSAAAPSDPGAAAGAGVQGVATALRGLGTGDALGAANGSGGSTPPGYRVNPKPEYPAPAREKGYQGTTVLRVRVLPDGKAGEIVVERSSGHEILDVAAIRTVKAWLFVPATRNGIAIPTWVSVPVRFSLAS